MINIIKGIDEVINGLTIIKGALLNKESAPTLVEAVKEAIVETIPTAIEEATLGIDVKSEVRDEVNEEPEVEASVSDIKARTEELEAMNYAEVRAIAGELGLGRTGKKIDLINSIIKAEFESNQEEEVDTSNEVDVTEDDVEDVEDVTEDEDEVSGQEWTEEDVEDFTEFLESLDTDELKSIAEEAGLKLGKRVVKAKLIKDLVADLDVLYSTLESLGYYDEDGEEEPEDIEEDTEDAGDDKESIIEEYGLDEYSVEDLADICAEYGLSVTGKRQALLDRVIVAIMDGTIEFDDEDGKGVEEVPVEEKVQEKKGLKVVKTNDKVTDTEDKVEEGIREKYDSGKLKDSAIKKFLNKYYEGDPECKDCSKCSAEDMLDCYVFIHRALVDDDGEVNKFEEPYVRENEYHCCGKALNSLDNNNLFCSVCGQEYNE